MRSPVLLITAFTPAVWGTTYAVTTEFLPPGRPLLAGVLRALPAGLLLLALTRQLPRGSWWWRSAVLGGLNIGVFFALLFVSAYRLPGGMAAVLGAAQPLVVAGLTMLLLTERVRAAHGARRRDRRGRRGARRADRGGPAGRRRPAGRAGRHRVDGARAGADQALGPAGRLRC